jgi:hypothetical protein
MNYINLFAYFEDVVPLSSRLSFMTLKGKWDSLSPGRWTPFCGLVELEAQCNICGELRSHPIPPWKRPQELILVFCFVLFLHFLWYWGLNSGPTPWATPPAHFYEFFFYFERGSHELFAWIGFELRSSWSLPPE